MNRTIVSRIASYHFAPTERNRSFLNAENVKDNIFVTGNTVIDSFKYTIRDNYVFHDETLNHLDRTKKMIILTAHRRENWGEGLSNIFTAVNRITSRYPDVIFVYPVHPNPIVKNEAIKHFSDNQNVIITSPLDVEDMHNLINLSRFVLTDSGGLQEEAPHLGKPVVVLRESTERPEAVEAGTAVLAGTDIDKIYGYCEKLLLDQDFYAVMANAVNPYGDGHASERIAAILESSPSD